MVMVRTRIRVRDQFSRLQFRVKVKIFWCLRWGFGLVNCPPPQLVSYGLLFGYVLLVFGGLDDWD